MYKNCFFIYSDQYVNEIDGLLREWTTVWYHKYEEYEKQKNTHSLMANFKNVVNVRNVILANRASIDEIKEHKRSNADKILRNNNMLGLDLIAFDSLYNRLDINNATTIDLYEELKSNNTLVKNQQKAIIQANNYDSVIISNNITSNSSLNSNNEQLNTDLRRSKFLISNNQQGQSPLSLTRSRQQQQQLYQQQLYAGINTIPRTILTFSVKIIIENLKSNFNNVLNDDCMQLYVNLFMTRDGEANYLWLVD